MRRIMGAALGAGLVFGLTVAPEVHASETLQATTTVNVRSGPSTDSTIIGYVAWGYTVEATGPSDDGWTPVNYNGRAGYVSSQYFVAPGTNPTADGPTGEFWTTAYLNVRNGPSTSHTRLDTLPTGAKVTLTGRTSNGFSQIIWYGGGRAWVASSWLSDAQGNSPVPPSDASDPTPAEPETPATTDDAAEPAVTTPASEPTTEPLVGEGDSDFTPAAPAAPATSAAAEPAESADTAEPVTDDAATTEPAAAAEPADVTDPAEPAESADSVTEAPAEPAESSEQAEPAATAEPAAEPSDEPTTEPAESAESADTADTAETADAADQATAGEPEKPATPTVVAQKLAASDLNLRATSAADSTVLTVIPSGTTLDVTGDEKDGRLPVVYQGQTGWVASQYVTGLDATGPIAVDPPAATGVRYTTDTLNVRSEAVFDGQIVGTLTKGQQVEITGVTQGAWTQILYQGTTRWVATQYLTETEPAPLASGADKAVAAAEFAKTKVGGPYVWGGNGPTGYDCSGLTKAAYDSVGITIPRTAAAQADYGVPVSLADIQVGDLVFYYSPISHVAIYVGDGQVVHASTYGVGIIYSKVDMTTITAIRRYV
jgi:uncharacterized protein YgiM (DUF1202 family)